MGNNRVWQHPVVIWVLVVVKKSRPTFVVPLGCNIRCREASLVTGITSQIPDQVPIVHSNTSRCRCRDQGVAWPWGISRRL